MSCVPFGRNAAAILIALVPALPAAVFAAGADIAHSGIQDTWNYTTSPVGGIRAYAIGSETCNVGTSPLAWNFNGTPGLAMNMYRIHNGRLEQIGLGWVKHACCAAQSSDPRCGGGCSPSGGLGAGCLDTYSASWNGGQSALGPRTNINPFTGSFMVLGGSGSGATGRRVQVLDVDVNPANVPGALFFVEGVYVSTEDALAQNFQNNASHRRVTYNGANGNLTVQGPTVAGTPAIQAWRDHGLGAGMPDLSVNVGIVPVPGEGIFWTANKVTPLGGGNYRYDYAVFNLCSDRACGSFSIPLPAGSTPSNIGFHDVFYHSGENVDATNWTVSTAGNQISWTAPAPGGGLKANAIWWGTMYNFWFELNRPPQPGTATLGLFKPGTPTSVAAMVQVPGGCGGMLGDVNASGAINGDDAQHFVNCLLAGTTSGGDCACADMDGNGTVQTADIPAFVDDTLGL